MNEIYNEEQIRTECISYEAVKKNTFVNMIIKQKELSTLNKITYPQEKYIHHM